jgi:hypothetical protein
MRRFLYLTLGIGLMGSSGICSTIDQLQATRLEVVTLLQSPAVPGGGGASLTVLSMFLGDRPSATSTDAPTGVTGAAVSATDDQGVNVTCSEKGGGTYLADSTGGALRYDPGAKYTFTAVQGGASYLSTGTAPPPEQVAAFTGVPIPVTVGQPYSLQRTAPAGGGQLGTAFVTVTSVGAGSATPLWTNAPQTPNDFLNFILNDGTWRMATVVIPGLAFPTAGTYLIDLQAVQRGTVEGTNLFTGSAILLGTGTAGLAQAQ